jgi:16S rRNA (guanine527-N7)-methyltransferase
MLKYHAAGAGGICVFTQSLPLVGFPSVALVSALRNTVLDMSTSEKIKPFVEALELNMSSYGVQLGAETLAGLAQYYALLIRWNQRLHLVAPCSPEEFATRHILESLLLLDHLPHSARVADIGSGAGLPIIPCLIAHPDLNATLVESSQKKAVFLREALNHAGISSAVTIIAKPFEDTPTPKVGFVTSRALDQFISKIPNLINWSPPTATLLLFGGESLRDVLRAYPGYSEFLIPHSERRFLFVVKTDHRASAGGI